MKTKIILFGMIIIYLAGCSPHSGAVETIETTSTITRIATRTRTLGIIALVNSATPRPFLTPTQGPTWTPSIEPTPLDCSHAMTQLAMNLCAGQEARVMRDELRVLLEDIHNHMGDSELYTNLLEIEDEWETVAQDHCEWMASFFEGGSMQPMIYGFCLADQYSERIEMLQTSICLTNERMGECNLP